LIPLRNTGDIVSLTVTRRGVYKEMVTIKISVLFFSQFRELTGTRETEVALADGNRLADLLERLSGEYGAAFRRELADIAGLRIMVNGLENEVLDGVETRLEEGDTVVLLPPVAGG